MQTITCWKDLERFGIVPLTGEACGLAYRILLDLTERGKRIVETCLGCRIAAEPWNRGTADEPHVASILLSPEMLRPVAIFGLLESGYSEAFDYSGLGIVAFDADDDPDGRKEWQERFADRLRRRYAYAGTAGDRNVHQMSGRVR